MATACTSITKNPRRPSLPCVARALSCPSTRSTTGAHAREPGEGLERVLPPGAEPWAGGSPGLPADGTGLDGGHQSPASWIAASTDLRKPKEVKLAPDTASTLA